MFPSVLIIFRADLFTSFGIIFCLCGPDPRDLFAKRTTFSVTSLRPTSRDWVSEERTEQTDWGRTRLYSVYVSKASAYEIWIFAWNLVFRKLDLGRFTRVREKLLHSVSLVKVSEHFLVGFCVSDDNDRQAKTHHFFKRLRVRCHPFGDGLGDLCLHQNTQRVSEGGLGTGPRWHRRYRAIQHRARLWSGQEEKRALERDLEPGGTTEHAAVAVRGARSAGGRWTQAPFQVVSWWVAMKHPCGSQMAVRWTRWYYCLYLPLWQKDITYCHLLWVLTVFWMCSYSLICLN